MAMPRQRQESEKKYKNPKESAEELAKRLNLNIKTVLKWKKAATINARTAKERFVGNRASVNLDVSPNCLSMTYILP
jgi:hypothetical protein